MAISGLGTERQQMLASNPMRDRKFYVGSAPPGTPNRYIPSINIGDFLDRSSKDGTFTSQLYQSLVTTIFPVWDELYRPQIAALNSCVPNQIQWDLMGDIRLVRNAIVHKKGVLTDQPDKLKCLAWKLSAGPLHVTGAMAEVLIEQLHTTTPILAAA